VLSILESVSEHIGP